MEVTYLSIATSLFFLLTISVFTYLFSKKLNFPYTVLLLIVWLILVPLSRTELFSFINHFKLTPELLFYVFLPILLFESAYNINYRQLLKNYKVISLLAIAWLIISAFVIWTLLYFALPLVGFKIPFLVCLLFWALIWSTDPVAVLSIFKELWAPRRLALIFEWESLFNDGTSLALFVVVLWIILGGWVVTPSTFGEGIWIFTMALAWWALFWTIVWTIFSEIIWKIKNNEITEITLTMVAAHITFITAELLNTMSIFWFHLHISWIVATTFAWLILWNFGRYKISPKVEAHMNQFWELFAFIANSLVFILIWLILSYVQVDFLKFIVPVILTIVIIMFARVISVYLPIKFVNIFKIEEHVPTSYITMLSWWSLRGAISLIMVMMLPSKWDENFEKLMTFQNMVGWNYDFSIKDFLMVLTIGCIMFTLLIKAVSIKPLLKKLWLAKLWKLEEFEYEEWKILTSINVLSKLNKIHEKKYFCSWEFHSLKTKYEEELNNAVENIKELIKWEWSEKWHNFIRTTLSLHALWIEKQYLKDLFAYNEIWEKSFRVILGKINRQIERLENWRTQLKINASEKSDKDIFERFYDYIIWDKISFVDEYIINRTKVIITRKVIKELNELSKIDFGFDKKLFDEIIKVYETFNNTANERMEKSFKKNPNEISVIEAKLVTKSLLKLEESVINDLFTKWIITPKIYAKFDEEIENWIFKDVNKIA